MLNDFSGWLVTGQELGGCRGLAALNSKPLNPGNQLATLGQSCSWSMRTDGLNSKDYASWAVWLSMLNIVIGIAAAAVAMPTM